MGCSIYSNKGAYLKKDGRIFAWTPSHLSLDYMLDVSTTFSQEEICSSLPIDSGLLARPFWSRLSTASLGMSSNPDFDRDDFIKSLNQAEELSPIIPPRWAFEQAGSETPQVRSTQRHEARNRNSFSHDLLTGMSEEEPFTKIDSSQGTTQHSVFSGFSKSAKPAKPNKSGKARSRLRTLQALFNPISGYGLVNAAKSVSKSSNVSAFTAVADLGGNNWGVDLLKAPEVWARGYTGQGVTVAVIDSGVDINHADLQGNIWINGGEIAGDGTDNDGNGYVDDINGWNFGIGQNNNNVMPGTNDSGQSHGTHVAGTIAAKNNGVGMTGVAPDAKIMALRLGDVSGGFFTNGGNLAQAIRYAVNNGAKVINMSLGWSDSAELQSAMSYAAAKNVITISASGNERLSTPGTPARYATQYGLSVGAVDRDRTTAFFSNGAGSNRRLQHVMAPGVQIYSTLPGGSYGFQSGTSMAAPHVAGVAALMFSANPNLTHSQIRQGMTQSINRVRMA